MLRYTDFLLESLLLESVVYYSDKFKKMLSQIDSPVATTLMDMESKDLEIVNNYLDPRCKIYHMANPCWD